MMNRFGFSTKKVYPHQGSSASNNGVNPSYSSGVQRISSLSNMGSFTGPRVSNLGNRFSGSDLTGNMGKPNQILGFNDTNSHRKSASKPSGSLSSVKSANFPRMSATSTKKNVPSSKLFGAFTPQNARQSMQNPCSTSRLSRVSSTGGRFKETHRMLTDQTWQRACQEKILIFLSENGYPHSITKQTLLRPSLSDISRIFEFLFNNFYDMNITISNGLNTSLDVVVPKMMETFGYPYPVKKSDLVSFSGGRQLGSVLAMLEYLINMINYVMNADSNWLVKPDFEFEQQDEFDEIDPSKVLSKLIDLDIDIGEDDEKIKEQIVNFAFNIFGTEEMIIQLEKEFAGQEEEGSKLEKELDSLSKLPKKIEDDSSEIENCDKFTKEMEEHNKSRKKVLNTLKVELGEKEEKYQKAVEARNQVQQELDQQKEIGIEYRYAIERCKQIRDELNKVSESKTGTREAMSELILKINKQKTEFEKFVNDIDEVICEFFKTLKNHHIPAFLPDLGKFWEQDQQWNDIYTKLKMLKSINVESVTDEHFNELEQFGATLINKFKDFQSRLLHQLSLLKGSVSIEIACKHDTQRKRYDKMKDELNEQEVQLQRLMEERSNNEVRQQEELKNFNDEIELQKKTIQALNTKHEDREAKLKELNQTILQKKAELELCTRETMNKVENAVLSIYNMKKHYRETLLKFATKLNQQNQELANS